MLTRLATALAFALAASSASAACYADYKARQDDPLRLHYGVIELEGPCDAAEAADEVARRIAREGWTLLNVVSVFDESGLEDKRESAGPYFLRF